MKKVLLTTTALVMTAGVASAEITFSGKGEAGVYRTAPTAAVAAVRGNNASANGTDSTTDAFASIKYDADTNLLTTKLLDTDNKYGDAPTAGEIAAQKHKVDDAKQALARAEAVVAEGSAGANLAELHDMANALDDVAKAQADLAQEEAILAHLSGTAATLKGATPKLKAYSGYDLDIAASGASDNGMTFAMAFDMGAGHIADQDDDRAMDAQAGTIDTSALTIGYAGYTVVIGDEKVDDLYDDDGWNADVSISGSLGDLTFTIATDMDDDVKAVAGSTYYKAESGTADGEDADGVVTDGGAAYTAAVFKKTEAVAAVYNPTSYAIGYSMGNIAFNMAGTEHDQFGNAAASMSLAYTVSDATTVTLSSDNLGTYKDVAKVTLKQKLSDAMTITASIKDDKDHALNTNKNKAQSSDISIAYTAGALSSTLATDEGSNWWVNAQYDLGGGATAFTTFDHTEFLVAGVNFKF